MDGAEPRSAMLRGAGVPQVYLKHLKVLQRVCSDSRVSSKGSEVSVSPLATHRSPGRVRKDRGEKLLST